MTDQQTADDGVCYIRSTLDDNGNAACLMQWGPIQALLTPDTALATARDLMAAAAAAETDIALIEWLRQDLGATDQVLGGALAAIRGRRNVPPAPVALRIEAVAGARTGRPYVTIGRGSMKGQLDPDQARAMALQWTETATAAQLDVRLRYALGEWGHLTPAAIEELFVLVQKLQR